MADTLRDDPTQFSAGEAEVVDGLPVLVEVRTLEPASEATSRALVQTTALAVGSFVAGAATVAVVARHFGKSLGRTGGVRRTARPELLDVVATRSFLVDVHTLGRRSDQQ